MVPKTAFFQATFNTRVFGIGPKSFTIEGAQSGRMFTDTTYTGNGTTTITTPRGSFTGGEFVEVGLAAACPTRQFVLYQVLPDSASGTFQQDSTYDVGSTPHNIATGDLNGDGSVDIVTTNPDPGAVSVLLNQNDGTATFRPAQSFNAGSNPTSIAVADLNGDGSLDLAVGDSGSTSASVLLNNNDGTGSFQAARSFNAGPNPTDIAVGDLNGDGSPDIVTTHFIVPNPTPDSVSILLNNNDGTCTFQPGQSLVAGDDPDDQRPTSIAIGDANGDGDPDLVVTIDQFRFADGISVFNSLNGTGRFERGIPFTFQFGTIPRSVAMADLKGDGGPLDILLANPDQGVTVMLKDFPEDFDWDVRTFSAGPGRPWDVAIGDLNCDGSLDVASANQQSDSVAVLLNNNDGTGTFQPVRTFGAGTTPTAIAVGDLNGDGSLDLAVANAGSANVSVLLNRN